MINSPFTIKELTKISDNNGEFIYRVDGGINGLAHLKTKQQIPKLGDYQIRRTFYYVDDVKRGIIVPYPVNNGWEEVVVGDIIMEGDINEEIH